MYIPCKESKHKETPVHKGIRKQVSIADNRPSQLRQLQLMKGIRQSTLSVGNPQGVMQMMLTRSRVNEIAIGIVGGTFTPRDLEDYDESDQYLILSRARDLGVNISDYDGFVTPIDQAAEGNSDIDHPDSEDAMEFEPSSFEYQAIQAKRGPGPSGPKDVAGFCKGVTYIRDNDGNIDFGTQPQIALGGFWNQPVLANSGVNLNEDVKSIGYGMLSNGNIVNIPNASRSQHFSIANRVATKHGQTAGASGASPAGLTWHHLLAKYQMVLVDREVHRRFGHNGGYYFW